MLFNTFPFAIFLAAVLVLLRALPAGARSGLLLGTSLLFYFLWVPIYLLLLLAEIVVNYALLRAIARGRRALPLAASVVFTLGLLAVFKYAGFFGSTVSPLSESLFGWAPPHPDIVLPLGISFFSFQAIGLAVDVHRGDTDPPRSLARYALFISFFPQLIAGPILRGAELLPQLERIGAATREQVRRGVWLLACGLAKKSILADFLLAPYVDQVFGTPGFASAPAHLVAVYGFAFQIYFDFSGYTDMARGMALLMGFELPANFLEPYLSRNPSEFWRRWHITLSRWLRDYLYVPLGGNRKGSTRTLVNLGLTMLLGGLWHGAAWNFVIWGGLHGVWLIAHRLLPGGRESGERPLGWRDAPRIFVSFQLICILWVFFRAASFGDATTILGRLTGSYLAYWPVLPTLIVLLCAGLHLAERRIRLRLPELRDRLAGTWGGGLEGAALGAILALAVAASGSGAEFIYFQF